MRKNLLILLLYTVHMVLNLLKCSRNSKIILFIFKQLFKICLIFSHHIKNFKLSQICFKILQILKSFEYGLYINSFILCCLSSKILATNFKSSEKLLKLITFCIALLSAKNNFLILLNIFIKKKQQNRYLCIFDITAVISNMQR